MRRRWRREGEEEGRDARGEARAEVKQDSGRITVRDMTCQSFVAFASGKQMHVAPHAERS